MPWARGSILGQSRETSTERTRARTSLCAQRPASAQCLRKWLTLLMLCGLAALVLMQWRPEDVAGALVLLACAVLAFGWYVAVSRLHLDNSQCLEIFLDCAILFFGGGLVVAQLVGRRKKREENWPHPAILVPGSKDAEIVREASEDGATVLGYNVHKEPWLWFDIVRMKHGVIVGGTGAGKSTFLENIVAQDVRRRFGVRRIAP
jgi:hypothetical protein